MNNIIKLFVGFVAILFFSLAFFSCKKDKEEEKPISHLDSFISLKAERDTIFSGQSIQIKAIAVGTNLKFKWTSTGGDILGSNDVVTYSSAPCMIGPNEVSCTVAGDNKSDTKTIIIRVF